MKFTLLVILALVIGTIAAQFLVADPGYVAIDFRGYTVETSVPGLVLILLAAAMLVWLIVRLIRVPRQLRQAGANYGARRAGKRFTQGLIEIAEGNYSKGERLLTRGAAKADAPLLNYLAAARAAQLQNQDARRDNWLKLAYEQQPEASNAILLTQAELQIAHEQYEHAQATLKQLDEQEGGNGQAVVLLARLFREREDWRQLGELLPRLRRIGKPEKSVIDNWSVDFHEFQLSDTAAHAGDVPRAWEDVPKHLKKTPRLQTAYISALGATGLSNKASIEVRQMLKSRWHPELVRLYGKTLSDDPSAQLQQAEKWLAKHPEDHELLLAAGRLCMATELWGKARSYLESALATRHTPEAYSVYGQLLTQLGESSAAAEAYRHGLTLIELSQPALPAPSSSSEST
ncbi:MAG: heme biosynthesis HemY N-terminal domain-containing protein [Pseudomonadota bacterium]